MTEKPCAHRWKKVVLATKTEPALYECRTCGTLQRKGKPATPKTHRGRP